MEPTCNVAVIGAGSARCDFAGRLAKRDDLTIALVETGRSADWRA